MTVARIISTLILTGFLLLTVNSESDVLAQTVPMIDIDIQVLDRYTRNELDSVSVALFFDGVLLDSTVTLADGRALFRISVTSLEQPAELPAELSLSPNYPNPFNSDTRVDLGVPEAQSVRIEVFNVIGQRVAVQSLNLDAGRYALNLSMGHLPVGVYFLRVSGRESRVEKMAKLGKGFMSQGAMFRMEAAGGYNRSQPVVERQSGADYLADTVDDNESGYLLRAERNRYRDFETNPEIQGNTELLVEMQRQNIVALIVTNDQEQSVSRMIEVSGEQFSTTLSTPDTLVLDSGIFKVRAVDSPDPGTPADFMVDALIEVISRDSTYTIGPFIPQEATVSGRVANDLEEFVAGANVQVYRQDMLYTSTTTGAGGEFSVEMLADGSMYSIVIFPETNLNGAFVPEAFYSFSPDAQVITPHPGGSYSLEFLLYTESPLTIPGGAGSLPAGPYTLANDGATVSIANIPPDLGIVGGSARAYSPTVNPDAFPGEFATRQQGFESGLISGGFASVNLLRSDGNGGVEPISELRDSTGAPVQVTLRFLMDPLDYDVLRDPGSLSQLPGYMNRPDTIDVPLYYYHEPSGDWLLSPQFGWLENERGAIPASELERIRSGEYGEPVFVTGMVDHFTFYNLDYIESRACLTGRIVDQNSNAVKDGKLTFRSMPQRVGRSFYSNTGTSHTDQQGYFRYVGPRTERNSGDDWNGNQRIDTFYAQGEYNEKNSCRVAIFDNNGSGYQMPQFSELDGCGNIGTIRVSLKEAKKEKFSVTFRDIQRDEQPGRPLFVDPRSVSGPNYAYATLTDLKVPLMGEIWNCSCDNGTPIPDCNRLSTIDGSGKASFEIPVLSRDSDDPVQKEEKLVGQFSYRNMRPDLGEGAYEFAECAYLTKTKPPGPGDPPIVVECEVFVTGPPVIEIVGIDGEIISDDPIPPLNFLYDEIVRLEATGTNVNGESIDHFDMFYWTNDLETLFIASRRVVTRPAHHLFGTGTGISIRAHGVNYQGFKGDTLATGISVTEVALVLTANQPAIATGSTTVLNAAVTGAVNTGVRWQSLTPGIASVDNQGEVSGLQPGTARIRAQSLADLSKTDEVELTVIQLVADFSVSPEAGDSLTEFTFDATSSIGNITAFEWDFGDGNSANGQVVNHAFGASGVFDVTLTVTGDPGLQISRTNQVSTSGRPLVVITADPQSGVAPLEVSFAGSASVSPSGVLSQYNWDFGDGNSSDAADVTHTYDQNGSYYAKLTITDNAANSASDSVLIRVVPAPVASFTVSPESGDPPLMVTVDASESVAGDGTIDRFSWDFDDGIIIENGDSTETHLYTVPGFYTIRLTVETSLGLQAFAEQEVSVGCDNQFTGNLTISSADQFPQIENICQVIGNMTISGLNDLTILPEFSNLLSITGSLTITSNNSLANISGFDNLTEIGGFFRISNNPSLTQIEGFNHLKRVGDYMIIQSNNELNQMIGFNDLRETQNLTIDNNTALAAIPGFTSLEKVNNLLIVGNGIQSVTDFGNLKEAPAGIDVQNNPNLTQIAGFEKLVGTINRLFVISNSSLEEIDAFHNLTDLGDLRVEGNTSLKEISGFNKVRRIPANLRIIDSPQLSAVNAFGILDEVRGQFIFSNTGYSACSILDIYFRIIDNNGFGTFSVSISGNPNTANAITIQSQGDLDALSGVCLINGSLTFSTQLSGISGLEQLRRVNGGVSINFNPNITNLEFLSNLRQADGINMRGNASLQSITGLESMRRLGSISIWDQPLITDMEPLAGLTQVTSGIILRETGVVSLPDFSFSYLSSSAPTILIQDNPALVDFDGLKAFNTAGLTQIINNPSLVSLKGFSGITSASGNILIRNNPLLTSTEGLHNLETMSQSTVLELNNNGIQDLNGLRNLKTAGVIRIENSPMIQDVDGLINLTSLSRIILMNTGISNLDGLSNVSGQLLSIFLENNEQLASISGLSGTDLVRSLVTISGNPLLTSLDGLQNIARIGLTNTNGVLHILNNATLQDADGLAGLTAVDEMRITGNPLLTNLDGLQNLVGTVVTLHIDNNASLEQINGLQGVSAVTSWIRVFGNVSLTNLDGFSGISGNVNIIDISQNPEMNSLSGLSGITSSNELSVGNTGITTLDGLENHKNSLTLSIGENPNLQNLDALSGLERVTRMFVRFNPSLVSVSGMTSLNRVVNDFNVSLNPALPSCDVDKLIAQIQAAQGIGGTITTNGNDPEGVCEPI